MEKDGFICRFCGEDIRDCECTVERTGGRDEFFFTGVCINDFVVEDDNE
jgi:hypothetical protein